MGFLKGFMEYDRIEPKHESVESRIQNFKEFIGTLSDEEIKIQSGRCMDCGIPFCMHSCPLHNDMPDINEFTCQGKFEKAYNVLSTTNNFPEFTGRLCPALCQDGCTLGIHRKSVGTKSVEKKIIEYAFEHGLVKPIVNQNRTFKKVAVVGSGPSGLACAQQLARRGHQVTVIEKMNKIGGLLRYGIPDFKLPKEILDRRLAQMELEGVVFKTSVMVGKGSKLGFGVHNDAVTEVSGEELLKEYDAVVLALGSEMPRDLVLPGRELKGIHFALDFLIAQNRENNGDGENPIKVAGKNVCIIGGGDTANDCIGVAVRKGAASVTEIEITPPLPKSVDMLQVWPDWQRIQRYSSSQEEGCTRLCSTSTMEYLGRDKVEKIKVQEVKMEPGFKFTPVEGTVRELDADVVLLAMGFVHPSPALAEEFGLETDKRGNLAAAIEGPDAYRTNNPKIFVAGDCRRGQSLVVRAIAEGRGAALAVDSYLNQETKNVSA